MFAVGVWGMQVKLRMWHIRTCIIWSAFCVEVADLRKGWLPNNIVNSTTPHDQMSAHAASYVWPLAVRKISGAENSAVPSCVCGTLSLNVSLLKGHTRGRGIM